MSEEQPLPQPEVQSPHTTTGSVDPQSVEGLFLAALAKPDGDQRRAFLDEACPDEEQRRRVEALLRAYHDAGSFLEKPAAGRNGVPGSLDAPPPDEVPLDFLGPSDQPGCLGTLGPYQVLETIGRGGMGIVLRALDTKLNRIVAVKVLAPELAANPNARRRFLREAQAAAAVSHPHVVTIHAVDEDKLPYLVMECVVGQSLQEKLDRDGALRLTEILRIGRQVAEGLAAAHQQGLIHRDIKPANILLENGVERVKITDFGLARAADDVAITRAGEVSGTPQYMSPEQARGEHVDQRSDLFSLGCVLYAMCTGRPPFRGDSMAAVIKRLTEDTPRPIAEVTPEIPAWLSDVIQRLLEKHADRRFQTAAEVAEVLAGHLASVQQPTRPVPPSRLQPPRPTRRLPLLVARVAVYGALAAIGCVVGEMGGVSAPTVQFLAVLFLAPLSWVAIWRGKRDGRRPWCDLSYIEPAAAAVTFQLGIALGFQFQGRMVGLSWASGFVALVIAGLVTLTLILALGGRRPGSEPRLASEGAVPSRVTRTRSERILIWLAILLLSMPILVLVCVAGAGVVAGLVAGLAKENAKARTMREHVKALQARDVAVQAEKTRSGSERASVAIPEEAEAPGQPAAPLDEPMGGMPSGKPAADAPGSVGVPNLPPGVRWETKSDVETFSEGKVKLEACLLSEGMFVALRRRSSFNGMVASDEYLATSVGKTTLHVPPGEYDVLVRDERFGWGTGSRGSIVVRERGLGTLTVERDLSASVKPRIDLDSPAYVSPGEQPHYRFQWNTTRYQLTRGQSLAVHKLATALVADKPDVPDAEVVASIRESWRRGQTLEENFREADGPLAWGKLVVPGEKPGTYRLAPIPAATLNIEVRTLGMQVSVLFPDDSESKGRAIGLEALGSHRLTVFPGKYRAELIDQDVHWVALQNSRPIPSRGENWTLADGDSATFVAERRWQDYVTPKCMLTEAEASERDKLETPYRLAWFGRVGRARNSNSRQYFLTPAQATFISRLFQGLADGQPDVAEDELLKAADAKSVPSLFPGMDGKSLSEPQIGPGGVMSPPPPGRIPPQDWNSLFVPGGQPKTWRLNVPKPVEPSPKADAAATGGLLPDSPSDDEIRKN